MIALTPTLKRVQVARSTLLLDQPFFGVLALGLKAIEDPSCKTAWTNGREMGFSPSFVATLTDDELTAVVAHEVMHCAAGHPWRRDARDPETWNEAADYAINPVLTKAGFQLPADHLSNVDYDGKWAEWIYARLPAKTPKTDPNGDQPGGDGISGGSSLGDVRDAPTDSDAPTEEDWKQATKQAAYTASARGSLPSSMRELIEETTASRVDWQSLLERYAQEVVNADYTWTRPNVRYIPSGLYLPSLRSKACGKFTIAIDTSGSIDTVLVGQFMGAIEKIAADLNPSSIDVIQCDAQIHRVDTFERGDPITMPGIEGRGGTSFVPVFEHIAASGEEPAILIYLTDMDGSFPEIAPNYPVIWANYGRAQSAPFGDVVACE